MNLMRFALFAILIALFAADTASAASTWLTAKTISGPSSSNSAPDIAVNARGDAAAVWVRGSGASATLKASTRPAGGAWHAPVTPLSGTVIGAPRVGIDGQGRASVIWVRSDGGERVWGAMSDAGGDFPAVVQLDSSTPSSSPAIAVNERGDAVAAWTASSGTGRFIAARVRQADGSWGGYKQLSQTSISNDAESADAAIDQEGRAVVTWTFEDSIQAAFHTPGSGWGKAETIKNGNGGAAAHASRAAIDASGRATVLWNTSGAFFDLVEAAEGSPSSGWAESSLPKSSKSSEPDVAVAPSGQAVATWTRNENGHLVIVAALRDGPGAPWGDGAILSDPTRDSATPSAAIDPRDSALVAWDQNAAVGHLAYASQWRAHGYGWDAQHALAAPAAGETTPRAAFDSGGDAVAAFVRGNPIQAADYDAAPVLSAVKVPASGAPGKPLAFSAIAVDLWSPPVTVAWDFGDGAKAAAPKASHTYAAPGDYKVIVTARDGVGNETSELHLVHVRAPGPQAPPPTGPGQSPGGTQPSPSPHSFAGLLLKRQTVVVRKRFARVKATCPLATGGSCAGTLRLLSGRKVIGRARFVIAAGKTVRIRVKVARVVRSARASARTHDGLGATRTTSAKLKLRRG